MGDYDVSVGLLSTTNVPLWWEILIMEEAIHVWGKVFVKSLYFPLNFAVKLKTTLENGLNKKKLC